MDPEQKNTPRGKYLPRWLQKPLGADYRNFRMYDIAPDGHCLFRTLQMILSSIGIDRTLYELRRVVADTVLDPKDEVTNETIKTWLELYKGASKEKDHYLMNEYRHMYVLRNAEWPLNQSDRELLWQSMLTSQYWGEHHACRIMEEQTQMRLLVINGDLKRPSLVWYHSGQYKPTHYAVVYLSGQHYNPISINGRFIFKWKEIPTSLQTFISQAYKKST